MLQRNPSMIFINSNEFSVQDQKRRSEFYGTCNMSMLINKTDSSCFDNFVIMLLS